MAMIMNPIIETGTANYIGRWFAQEGLCLVPKRGLRFSNSVSWVDLNELLELWQHKGWIRMIKSPDDAELDDICIELITWPGTDQPFPDNWIRDRPI